MDITKIQVGSLDTNCYLLQQKGHIAVIDPGGDYPGLEKKVEELADSSRKDLSDIIDFILVTHCHWDHVHALSQMTNSYSATVCRGPNPQLSDDSPSILEDPACKLNEGDTLDLGNLELEIWSTPGHSPDSISVLDRTNQNIFSGDLVFAGEVGRTDLPGGSRQQLVDSIERLTQLGENWTIYPGHGSATTVKRELNRFSFL